LTSSCPAPTRARKRRCAGVRSRIKTLLRTGHTKAEQVPEAQAAIDKAAAHGIIHPNTAARRKSRLMRRLRIQVAVNSFLVDRNSVAVEPYFPMDEQKPLGPLTLAFVKKFGDVAFALGGHPRGLGLFTAFNFRKMHKGATGIYETVKSQLDPHRKMNPGKMTEVWTRFDLPIVNVIPPEIMGFALEVAAVVRRLKPTSGRYVKIETGGR